MCRSVPVRCAVLALTVLTVCALAASASVRLTRGAYSYADRTVESFTLENEWFRLSLAPDRGGMAYEWVDKRAGHVNVIYLASDAGGYGGLFDDHGFRVGMPYACRVLEDSPERCTLELSATEEEITYTKRITVYAGRPVIEATYHLVNAGQEESGKVLFRNVIRPSGGHRPESDLYVMPLTTGVVRSPKGFGESDNLGAPWTALVNTLDRRGVAVAFAGDKVRRYYSWTGSAVAPTYEWMYAAIAPGTQYMTTAYLAVLHGFTNFSDVTRDYAAESAIQSSPDGKVAFTHRVSALWAPLPRVRLMASVRAVGADAVLHQGVVSLGDVELDAISEGAVTWTAPGEGVYVLDVVVTSSDREIGRYEEVFTVGNPPGAARDAYARKLVWRAEDPVAPVAGWKRVEPYVLQPTPADMERGYLVFQEVGPDAGHPLKEYVADMGIGEKESVNLAVHAWKEIGPIRLTVEKGTLPADRIRLTAAEPASQVIWGKKYVGQKLLDSPVLAAAPGETAWFWALLDTTDLTPGEYTSVIRLTPEKAGPVEFVFTARVHPVEFPQDLLMPFTPNSLFNYLAAPAKGGAGPWDERKGRLYAADMRAHGIRGLCAYGQNAPGMLLSGLRLRESGEPLLAAVARDPARFRQGDLPALDLSYWDPMINLALEYDQYYYRTSLGNEKTYDANFIALSRLIYGDNEIHPDSEAHTRVRRWILREIPRYLREKGYQDIATTIGDEIPFDRFPAWVGKAEEAKACGFAPGVTTSLLTLASPTYLKMLAGPSDYWVIGSLNDDLLKAARTQGFIEPTDWVETYCSSANYWRRYDFMRRWAGWWPAFFELDAVWIQEYWRWNRAAAVVFPDDVNGPKSSGAWEGCRDGLEDANYYLMALDLVRALEATPGAGDIALAAREDLDRICGKRPDSLIRFEYADVSGTRHLACVTLDTHVFRTAKARLLDFIVRYRPKAAPRGATVAWGRLPLVEAGRPRVAIASGAGLEDAAAVIADRLTQRSGGAAVASSRAASLTDASLAAGSWIAVLAMDDHAVLDRLSAHGLVLPISATYPGAGAYIIHSAPNPWNPRERLIVILGRDGNGARLGARNAAVFMRRVRPLF